MQLVFELSHPGRGCTYMPKSDVPEVLPDAYYLRDQAPCLPQVAEIDLDRHYNELAHHSFGVCDGFYPLGSCTMKYNPRLNEEVANLAGFSNIHPLQPQDTVQGALSVLSRIGNMLTEITGMDSATLQPTAGAQGEFTGLLLIRAYHLAKGDSARTKIIVPDSAHGTNPATAAMAGFSVVQVPSNAQGGVDVEALRKAVGPETAGLMLTNPNTLGLFDPNIVEICDIIHQAGGLCYYDGANLNPIMGIARPGDMGFDCVHVNLHKTFSTPHGGGGPGSGPVACKKHLAEFLPTPIVVEKDGTFTFETPSQSFGRMRSFYGNFGIIVRAYTFMRVLGKEGIPEAARGAVLNANYLMHKLEGRYDIPYPGPCMHEFVIDVGPLKKETGASALDVAKRFLDFGMHAPTMYFPLVVHEALMVEPTETENRETLDKAAQAFLEIWDEAHKNPEILHEAPHSQIIGRPDDVQAARTPILRWRSQNL